MKKRIKMLITIIVLLLPVIAEATTVCYDKIYINVVQGGGCYTGSTHAPTSYCTGGTYSYVGSGCHIEVWNICCDVAALNQYEGSIHDTQIITGVAVGSEASAAESAYQAYNEAYEVPDPAAGFTLVGSYSGYAYVSAIAQDGQSVNVQVDLWKRALYTKGGTGNIQPIETINSGNAETLKTGVKDGVTEAVNNLFGAVGETGSPSATGTGAGDVMASDGVTGKSLSGTSDFFDASMTVPQADSISTKVTNFLSSHPAMNIFREASITAEATQNGACTWNFNYKGRNVEFSLDRFSAQFGLLGSVLLSIASIYSMFVAFGRG